MTLVFVGMYLLINVLIGFLASRRVKNSEDFALAGRNMSIMVASVSIFATWFGSETIMSSSVEFGKHGFLGVVKDPFGAAVCLFLIGTFFARKLYTLNIVTFSDYFRLRYGGKAELTSAILLSISYLWWVAAQLQAMGTIIASLTEGYSFTIGVVGGIFIGAFLIAIYTAVGGMWAVSITDFVQTIVILGGLIVITVILVNEVGGASEAIAKQPEGFFRVIPGSGLPQPAEDAPPGFTPLFTDTSFVSIMGYIAAWMTVGLGSIPQQDVFQRTMSTRSPAAARKSAYIASFMYVTIALFPLIIGMCSQILPGENGALMIEMTHNEDTASQMLPTLAKLYTPEWVQIIFFGALISAIMSTASGAILAPATIVTENFVRPIATNLSDKGRLRVLRLSVLLITVIAALISCTGDSIYDLAAAAATITLVSLLVPLVCGVYWRKASLGGAMLSMLMGVSAWAITNYLITLPDDLDWVPMFSGWGASMVGMVIGSLAMPQPPSRLHIDGVPTNNPPASDKTADELLKEDDLS